MRTERAIQSWVGAVSSGWGTRAAGSLQAAIAEATTATGEIDAHRMGYRLRERGHSIDEVLGWLGWLREHRARAASRLLGDNNATVAISSGWASAALAADDPHAVSFEVLRLRLHQHLQLAKQLGVPPNEHVAIVVVQCRTPDTDAYDVLLPNVLAAARSVFGRGETVALSPSQNVLILAQRSSELARRIQQLSDICRSTSTLEACTLHMWVETIGTDENLIDEHLNELAGTLSAS
jgi:hypothetical protein